MVDNQHRHIQGYRDLTLEEIGVINRCKEVGVELGVLVQLVQQIEGVDQRAAALGKSYLQTGLMWLIRSVARPEGFG